MTCLKFQALWVAVRRPVVSARPARRHRERERVSESATGRERELNSHTDKHQTRDQTARWRYIAYQLSQYSDTIAMSSNIFTSDSSSTRGKEVTVLGGGSFMKKGSGAVA